MKRKIKKIDWPQNMFRTAAGEYWFRSPINGDVASLGMRESSAAREAIRLNQTIGYTPPPTYSQNSERDMAGLLECGRIVQMSTPMESICGIYFLLSGGVIIYVGQSEDCMRRISEHSRDHRKTFDAYHIERCLMSELCELEQCYIEKLSPALNIRKRMAA